MAGKGAGKGEGWEEEGGGDMPWEFIDQHRSVWGGMKAWADGAEGAWEGWGMR